MKPIRPIAEYLRTIAGMSLNFAHPRDPVHRQRVLDGESTIDRYLSHQFKTYTGMPLIQFIIKKRLTAARNMIRSGMPAMDACMLCGFNDYSNFHKAFKKEFGKIPKEFRNI